MKVILAGYLITAEEERYSEPIKDGDRFTLIIHRPGKALQAQINTSLTEGTALALHLGDWQERGLQVAVCAKAVEPFEADIRPRAHSQYRDSTAAARLRVELQVHGTPRPGTEGQPVSYPHGFRTGKSATMAREIEEALARGEQIAILNPDGSVLRRLA